MAETGAPSTGRGTGSSWWAPRCPAHHAARPGHPNRPVTVAVELVDGEARQRLGQRIDLLLAGSRMVPHETVRPGLEGSDPQRPVGLGGQSVYRQFAYCIRSAEPPPPAALGALVQAAAGTHPEAAPDSRIVEALPFGETPPLFPSQPAGQSMTAVPDPDGTLAVLQGREHLGTLQAAFHAVVARSEERRVWEVER